MIDKNRTYHWRRKMTDLPEHSNGIRIGNVSPDNRVRVYMFNDGEYTYWVEYDRNQLEGLLDVVEARLSEMKALKALREIAEANSVQAGPDKDMYRRWRRVATNAIDIARKALEDKQ